MISGTDLPVGAGDDFKARHMKAPTLVEDSESREYLHRTVWRVVIRQIEYAEANPTGALYDYLVAMVFALHSIEGYINFLGERVAPELWEDERATFKGASLTEKLKVVCERCGIGAPPKGKRPYSTVLELKGLRDKIVHPKTQTIKRSIGFDADHPPPLFAESLLATLVSPQKALRARDDVKRIVHELHNAAVAKFPNLGLGDDPLEGILRTRATSTRHR